MMDPELEKMLAERGPRPVRQPTSVRHGYEPTIFAGMKNVKMW
jgi:Holliday junction resolvase